MRFWRSRWSYGIAAGLLWIAVLVVVSANGGLSRLEKIHHAQHKAAAKCPKAPAEKVVRANVALRGGQVHALRHGPPQVSHTLGGCAPAKVATKLALARKGLVEHGQHGCDLSNNDPQTTAFIAMRQNGITFCWLKVVEGVSFHDHTASFMRYWADRAGIAVGGYDFAHVCLVGAASEAHFFALELRADGLTGLNNRLLPVLDAEYGGSGCSTIAWVNAWIQQMANEGFANVGIYTGCWWWNPHAGRWWPRNDIFPWISGYPHAFPCSDNAIVVHQWTDQGALGGGAVGDENTLLGQPGQIAAGPPPVVIPREVQALKNQIVYFWDLRQHQRLSVGERHTLDSDMNRIYFLGWQPHRSQPTQDWTGPTHQPGADALILCKKVRVRWARNRHGRYVRRLIDTLWRDKGHVRVHVYNDPYPGCVRMRGDYKVAG